MGHLYENYKDILLVTSIDKRKLIETTLSSVFFSFQDLLERVVPPKGRSLRADGSSFLMGAFEAIFVNGCSFFYAWRTLFLI